MVAVSSNPASLTVAERLDVALAVTGTADRVVRATLTNAGNGDEAFALAAAVSPAASGTTVRLIAVDRDGDGAFDPARDAVLDDARTPTLAPGAPVPLLVVLDGGEGLATLTLSARAATGSGTPGTLFAGMGDGGGDAVVGSTGAAATVSVAIGGGVGTPTLTKRQRVAGPSGATPVRGATITYTLDARFSGATRDAALADPIPAGTAYVAGSLTLDGAPLTDAADADPGAAGADGIRVALGDVAAATLRTVEFQVTIQ